MVVGFRKLSDSDSAGSSIGKPPACRMPRFTSSTRLLKCMWQGCASDHVLRIAITGFAPPSSRPEAHLHGARAVTEGAQVVGREPAGAAQLVGLLAGTHRGRSSKAILRIIA